ncbi:hypothetical protein [Tsukamurella tyrosinosolvens]|uniref:hypothetical protein n=1 Tax=Tsukamurella tyrosinosolvens TaxID=57704 RepID=UPI001147579C|nr:hypothetical protein [Tsukamurella tyrosinosolvens]
MIYNAHPSGVLFIDVESGVNARELRNALKQQLPVGVRWIVVRWPDTLAPDLSVDDISLESILPQDFVASLGFGSSAIGVGVLAFQLSTLPRIVWLRGEEPDESDLDDLVDRCARVEIRAMLGKGRAIWQPDNYHYELPSGHHSASFIRLSDMFRSRRDIEVLATWFVQDLVDGIGILVDSASLLPLAMELCHLAKDLAGWGDVKVVSLADYPATPFEVGRAIAALGAGDAVLAIVSVNGTGQFHGLVFNALRSDAADDSRTVLSVVVDRQRPRSDSGLATEEVSRVATRSLVGIGDLGRTSDGVERCVLCSSTGAGPVVRIDSSSYNAFALPQDNLIMPAVEAARRNSDLFSELNAEAGSTKIAATSVHEIRSALSPMEVLISFDVMLARPEFRSLAVKALRRKFPDRTFGCLVTSEFDQSVPGFTDFVDCLREAAVLDSEAAVVVVDDAGVCVSRPQDPLWMVAPLIFTLGSVSGWRLRRLQLFLQDLWHDQGVVPTPAPDAFVLVARSESDRQWENLYQSFETKLEYGWKLMIPSFSPLQHEYRLLENPAPVEILNDVGLEIAASLLKRRREIALLATRSVAGSEAGVSAGDILWGCDEKVALRNNSIYGLRLQAKATYVAVACAMHERRQQQRNTDPRWYRFDFVSIGRSYFDGILVACMLRWSRPGELFWGSTPHTRTQNIIALIANSRDLGDCKILYGELLLAAAQGKIPAESVESVCEHIVSRTSDWSVEDRAVIAAGIAVLAAERASENGVLVDLLGSIAASSR